MQFILTLLSNSDYIDLPQGFVGWVGWFALLSACAVLYIRFARSSSFTSPQRSSLNKTLQRLIFFGLVVMAPFSAVFLIIEFPATGALPPPGRTVEIIRPDRKSVVEGKE